MKKLIIFLLFATCHLVASSQIYVDGQGYVRYQQPSPQVVHDTIVKTVTVTVKDTVYYCPPTTPPVVVQPVPDITGYKLVYQNNFDKLSDLTTNNGQYGNGTVVNGTFYSRPANVSSGTRSELQISSSVTPTEGAAQWDAKYEVIVRNNGHSWQIHPETSGGSASPGLWHIGGKFVLMNWTKDRGNIEYPTGVTIPLNTWNTYRIEWKYGTNGYLKFYMDGKLIMSKTGRVNDGSGGYLKFGWNGWGSDAAQSRIYIDNIRVYEKVTSTSQIDLKSASSRLWTTETVLHTPSPSPVPTIDTVPPAKTYQLELTESEANTLLYILNKGKLDGISGEDATLVAVLIQRVTGQLRRQASTK
jgi:hypothetical protein